MPPDGSIHERSSDESTTASDVLIRSTLDKSERSIHDTNGSVSKCSKSSYGAENFNSTGPQKIKISKKHLREINPFDDGQNPRSSSDSDGKVPSSLLGKSKSSKSNSNSSGSSDSRSSGAKTGGQRDTKVVASNSGQPSLTAKVNVVRNANDGPSFPKGVDSNLSKRDPVRKLAEKSLPTDTLKEKSKPATRDLTAKVEKETRTITGVNFSNPRDSNVNAVDHKNGAMSEPLDQLRSTPKYFVERHTPQKQVPMKEQKEIAAMIPERKNLLQDLEDSVEITTVQGMALFLV